MAELSIDGILETCLYVKDLVASERFYGEVLGLVLHSKEPGKFVFFRVGSSMLLIFDPEDSRGGSHELPDHGASGVQHLALAVDESLLDAWKLRLENKGVAIEQDFIWPHGRRSLYFRDPHGHSIELASPALWQ